MPASCSQCHRATPVVLVAGGPGSVGRAICGACHADLDPAGERRRQLEKAEAETATLDQLLERGARSRRLIGYVALFDQPCRPSDDCEEIVSAGAFGDAIRRGGLVLLLNHDRTRVVAKQADNSLRVREDPAGLFLKADVASAHDDILNQAASGELHGSFSFRERASVVELTQPPRRQRILRNVALSEVSVTTRGRIPAYRDTWLGLDTDANRRRAAGAVNEVFDRLLLEAEV